MESIKLKSLIDTTACGNRSFDLKVSGSSLEYYITQIHDEPKQMLNNDSSLPEYVEIAMTHNNERVSVGTGKANLGKIYLYCWLGFHEYFTADENGEQDAYRQEDIYGFKLIANSLNEFCDMLYCNGTLSDLSLYNIVSIDFSS